jgi:uncharacterized protein with PIN domain
MGRGADNVYQPRFLADSMLGSLTKKLRMLGVDTLYIKDATDGELKYAVRSQGRILLTRDASLAKQLGEKALLVAGSDTHEEFVSTVAALRKSGCRPRPMSLCLKCNAKLVPVDPASAKEKVPLHVLEKDLDLKSCPECGNVYWKGTHTGRMQEEIEWMRKVLEKDDGP